MKEFIVLILLVIGISSCNNYDVVIRQSEDIVIKYKCKNGKDTLNSKKYLFYKTFLRSEATLVYGKKEGSVIDYFPNGNIENITNFKNNLPNGINKIFNDHGTLLRRSLYINGKQVLFESRMVNSENTVSRRKLLARFNTHGIWAGELYSNIGDTIIMTNYKGMYVDLILDDTISLEKEYTVKLKVTLPIVMSDPELIIGEFDKNLVCVDTLYYIKSDSTRDIFSFNYRPEQIGNLFLAGKLILPDKYVKEDVYFFKGFYVKED